jgi:hypothetical protein
LIECWFAHLNTCYIPKNTVLTTFRVVLNTGEESVPEKFFFYATQNSTASIAGEPLLSRPESLRELPPDPVFPYALLPTPAAVGGVGALLLGLPLTVVPVVAASGASAGEAQAQNGSGSVATAQVKVSVCVRWTFLSSACIRS